MKKCPYCSEEIQSNAKKCKWCGEWLEEEKMSDNSATQTPDVSKEHHKDKIVVSDEGKQLRHAEQKMKIAYGITIFFIIAGAVGNANKTEAEMLTGLLGCVAFAPVAYGFYKKSKICSIASFIAFVIVALISIADSGLGYWIIFLAVLGFIYFNGMMGAIEYAKIKNIEGAKTWEIVITTIMGVLGLLIAIGYMSP